MKSFRKFLTENNIRLPFGAGTQHTGYFDLPDLTNLYEPQEQPRKGWGDLPNITKAGINMHQMQNSDRYVLRQTLIKCRALAENVMSAIELRKQIDITKIHHSHYQKNHDHAQFDEKNMMIHGLAQNEILGGEYPRFRTEEMDRAAQLKIIFPDPLDPKYWALSINKLREEMHKLEIELKNYEKWYGRIYRTSKVLGHMGDQMLKPTDVPNFTTAR